MPRDYAKSTQRQKKPGQLPGWAWMLGGLAIGLFVAFLVYLNNARHPGNQNGLSRVIEETIDDVRDVKKKQLGKPVTEGEKLADDEPPKTSFDFYRILPELEVVVPDQELARQETAEVRADEKIDYILQIGSFRQFDQADQLKAKLALKGVESNIETVNINAKTWHRVRVGPIHGMTELNRTRKRLMENGIDSIVLKSRS